MPFDEEELDPHGECAAEITKLRTALSEIHILAGRQGPENEIDALNRIEAAAAAALRSVKNGDRT